MLDKDVTAGLSSERAEQMSQFVKAGYHALFAAGLIHIIFCVFFYYIGAINLAFFNILSFSVYFYCYQQFPKAYITGNFEVIYYLITAELISHGYFACYYFGLDSGFQYYMQVVVVLALIDQGKSLLACFIPVIVGIFASVMLDIWLRDQLPQIIIDDSLLTIVRNSNLAVFLSLVFYIVFSLVKNSNLKRTEAIALAVKDSLTGLDNRLGLDSLISKEIAVSMRTSHPLSILIIDIDFFKSINDQYGHLCGDSVLIQLSTVMKKQLRAMDTLGRWGGEEFLVVLPDTDGTTLAELATRLNNKVKNTTFEFEPHKINLTISIGGAIWDGSEPFNRCIERADIALYQSKDNGRDQFKLAQ